MYAASVPRELYQHRHSTIYFVGTHMCYIVRPSAASYQLRRGTICYVCMLVTISIRVRRNAICFVGMLSALIIRVGW
eukprot:1637742-Rhodomonas_salina.1